MLKCKSILNMNALILGKIYSWNSSLSMVIGIARITVLNQQWYCSMGQRCQVSFWNFLFIFQENCFFLQHLCFDFLLKFLVSFEKFHFYFVSKFYFSFLLIFLFWFPSKIFGFHLNFLFCFFFFQFFWFPSKSFFFVLKLSFWFPSEIFILIFF